MTRDDWAELVLVAIFGLGLGTVLLVAALVGTGRLG